MALVLRRTIWSWIQYHPSEFALLFTSNRRLEGGPELLFDHVHNLAESTRKKLAFWPMMNMLLILCPDIVGKAAVGDGRKGGSLAKKVNFLETLRKSLRNNKLSDMAALCCVDICKAATYTPRSETGLRLLVPDIEGDLKEKLFDPQRPFVNSSKQVEVPLMIDLFVALFRLDPHKAMRELVPVCTAESSPIAFKVALVKGCVLLASERHRLPWNPDLSLLYPQISRLLRNMFKDLVFRLHNQDNNTVAVSTPKTDKRSFSRGTSSSKPLVSEDASGRSELLHAILQLWNFDVTSASYGLSFDQSTALSSLAGSAALGDPDRLMKAALQVDSALSLVWVLGHMAYAQIGAQFRLDALNVIHLFITSTLDDENVAMFSRQAGDAAVSCSSSKSSAIAQQLIATDGHVAQRHWVGLLHRVLRNAGEWHAGAKVCSDEFVLLGQPRNGEKQA